MTNKKPFVFSKTLCLCRTNDLIHMYQELIGRGGASFIQCGTVTDAINVIFNNPCTCGYVSYSKEMIKGLLDESIEKLKINTCI